MGWHRVTISDIDIARKAFASPEWRAGADAIFSAAGVSVSVVDFGSGEVLSGGRTCAFCPYLGDRDTVETGDCVDRCPEPGTTDGRVLCRAGLPALFSAVMYRGRIVAHVMVTGFVTSTRERRGRYEHLLNSGVSEEAARRRIKSLPILARAQAGAFLQMAVASATTVFAATLERMVAAERVEELRLFVTSGHNVASAAHLDTESLSSMVSEALELAGADACALLRPAGAVLEVAAVTEGWRGSVGSTVPRETTVAGKAFDSGRASLSSVREDGTISAAVPLTAAGRVLGVFELRFDVATVPAPAERLTRVARFAQFAAIALERESERVAVERAMSGYTRLNGLASQLGGQTEATGVATLLLEEIRRTFDYDVAGVVLSGWGVDRVDLVVSTAVESATLDTLLSDVTGRDCSTDPFAEVSFSEGGGLVDSGPVSSPGAWALSSVEIGHGLLDVGWLFVARADGGSYSAQDRALLEGFAAHGGPAFGRSALFARVRDDYASTIEALSATLSAHSQSGRAVVHAGKVMEYAVLIGEQMGLEVAQTERLRIAGLLHDMGQAGLPGTVTLSTPTLTPAELLAAASRADAAPTIVEQIEFLESLTPVVLHHHENWDGSGYPHGLSGTEIPVLSRVLRVADAYDELTASSAKERRQTPLDACDQIAEAAGRLFDPEVARALSSVVTEQIAAGLGAAAATELTDDGLRPALPA